MQIEISGEVEALIRAELAAGRFGTVEECIAAMAKNWDVVALKQCLPIVPKDIAIDALADEQGVEVIRDAALLRASFWPENESVDDFVAQIRELRCDESARVR